MKKTFLFLMVALFLSTGLMTRTNAQSLFSGAVINEEVKKMNLLLLYDWLPYGVSPYYNTTAAKRNVNVNVYKTVERFGERVRGDLVYTYPCIYENGLLKNFRTTDRYGNDYIYILSFDANSRVTEIAKYESDGSLEKRARFLYSYSKVNVNVEPENEFSFYRGVSTIGSYIRSDYGNTWAGEIKKITESGDEYYDYDFYNGRFKYERCNRIRIGERYGILEVDRMQRQKELSFDDKLHGRKRRWDHDRNYYDINTDGYYVINKNLIYEYVNMD